MGLKIGVVSSVLVALPLSIWLATRPPQVPDIDVVNTHDFGIVDKGKVAVVNLPVRNLGNAPLKVEGISTSCGCTTAKLSSMVIPPGGEANLRIEYDSNAHESDKGALERYVFIASNDPKDSDLQIKFSVVVRVRKSN